MDIEPGGQQIDKDQHANGGIGGGVDTGVKQWQIPRQQPGRQHWPNQLTTEQNAQNNGSNRQAFNPAIGFDQLRGRQQFSQDAVLGGRIRGRAQTNNGVGDQGVAAKQHQHATQHFDEVADQHHFTLGHGIGKGADKRRQYHVEQGKQGYQGRLLPLGRMADSEQGNRRHKQGVISQ